MVYLQYITIIIKFNYKTKTMKKATELKNWIGKIIEKLIPSEKPNIAQNQEQIMNLLFYSNFTKISTKESITIYQNIKHSFEREILEREVNFRNELELIDKFKFSKKQRIEQHIKNPDFDKPIRDCGYNIEFVRSE